MKENVDLDPMGIKWMGNTPDVWGIDAVKRHYDIRLGKMLQNAPATDADKLVPYIKALQVTWGKVVLGDLPEMWASPVEISQYEVGEGDLLVCEGGEVGRCGIVQSPPKDCIIQNAVHRVRPKNWADSRFLHYVLHAVNSSGWFDVLCNKATIAHFTREKFADLRIPFPSDTIQRAVATFLDRETERIAPLISKKRRQIELLLEKRAALISHAVTKGLDPNVPMKDSGVEWLGEIPETWKASKMKFVCSRIVDGVHAKPDYVDSGVPFLTVENLTKTQGISFDGVRYISEEDHREFIKRADPRIGDILITKDGTLGVARVVETDREFSIFVSVAMIRPCREVLRPHFLRHLLESPVSAEQFQAQKAGSALKHIHLVDLRNLCVPVPPLKEQDKILGHLEPCLDQIQRAAEYIDASIAKLREYRTALISAAVTGKIDVRETSI